jgi:hypothetical protein
MQFLIDIEFTKILIQFKQKEIFRFIHDMKFQLFFTLNFFFVNYKYLFEYIIK